MGRKSQEKRNSERKTSIEEAYGWPWKLSISLDIEERPRICFLSCKEREYFPEDPGYSRHGIEYSMNCHPGDTPNPSYVPSEDRLQKPVSLKGYGMGGLSAPRFPKEKSEVTPDFGNYQPEISESPKKKEKKKRPKYFYLFEENYHEPCVLKPSVFGVSSNLPRIPKDLNKNVGVGHYDIRGVKTCKKMPIETGFGQGPGRLIAPTPIRCTYEAFDSCLECNVKLTTADYYRSRIQIKVFDHNSPPESEKPHPARGGEYISLCRRCYCHKMNSNHKFWTKDRLSREFQKIRHCVNIHEHNELPVFTHKVHCKEQNKLTRKEALMSKYFTNACERTLKEVRA